MIDHEKYSAPIARVYQDASDMVLQSLARRFCMASATRAEAYEASMLAQVNAVKREASGIVNRHIAANEPAIDEAIRTVMLDALEDERGEWEDGVRSGQLEEVTTTPEESIQERAEGMSANTKLLLGAVALNMAASAADTYRKGVYAAAEAMRGVDREAAVLASPTVPVPAEAQDYNRAVKAAVRAMVDSGVTGFVDRAGRHWSPEAYAAMTIKTTIGNAATQAVLDRNAEYGNSLVSVRTNATARPGCAPWQGTVIDFADEGGTFTDGSGGSVYAYPVSATSYGQAAGIFGINCNHTPPIPFIAGSSVVHHAGSVDPDVSAANYELTQRQRRLERAVRQAKREAAMYEAAGATDEYRQAVQRVRQRQAAVRQLVNANPGVLVRDYNREWTYGYNN